MAGRPGSGLPQATGARSAKLILRAKNSFWLDYLYGQFQDLFGDGLESWNGKMRKVQDWWEEVLRQAGKK